MSDFKKCPDCNVTYTPIPPHVCNFKLSQAPAMSDAKPQHFYIYKNPSDLDCSSAHVYDNVAFWAKDPIHVIEHSAYATLEKDLAIVRDSQEGQRRLNRVLSAKYETAVAANEDLKMVCRRLAAARSLETRDKIAKQCHHLFKGNILRESEGEGEGA